MGLNHGTLGICMRNLIYMRIFRLGFLRGDVVVTDALSLLTRLPLVGDETLSVKFKTVPYEGSKYSYEGIEGSFPIISCTKLNMTKNTRKVRYKLEFVSKERIADLTKVVRRRIRA